MRTSVLAAALLVFGWCGMASAQLRESDEDRLAVFEPPVTVEADVQEPGVPAAVSVSDRELKYVAGPDGQWFTADDALYHSFVVERAGGAQPAKRTCLKPDGSVSETVEFSYDGRGRLSREASYDGSGAKQYDAVYQYNAAGRKTRAIRYNPAGDEIWSMNYEYDPKGMLIKDFEYKGAKLDKWHSFEYDRKRRLAKAREYKTLDGDVFAAKEFFYGRDGRKSKEHKYTGPGPDGAWFTKDDVMQYYTVFEYGKAS